LKCYDSRSQQVSFEDSTADIIQCLRSFLAGNGSYLPNCYSLTTPPHGGYGNIDEQTDAAKASKAAFHKEYIAYLHRLIGELPTVKVTDNGKYVISLPALSSARK
jgi:hypothetical protein